MKTALSATPEYYPILDTLWFTLDERIIGKIRSHQKPQVSRSDLVWILRYLSYEIVTNFTCLNLNNKGGFKTLY